MEKYLTLIHDVWTLAVDIQGTTEQIVSDGATLALACRTHNVSGIIAAAHTLLTHLEAAGENPKIKADVLKILSDVGVDVSTLTA